jgi:hypothetical protein
MGNQLEAESLEKRGVREKSMKARKAPEKECYRHFLFGTSGSLG